jgi:type VI secretion system protein ImpJ
MKQLQPVLWTKGTLLTPQHLQLQDRFLEDSLNFRLQALRFCPWGFSELVLDQEQLADGHLVVSRASGIFPDGLLFDIPGPDQPPPSKALAEFFDPGMRDLDIYLTVPDYRPKGVNVSPVGRSVGARYLAELTTVVDENTGANEKPIQIARKNLSLLAANETREGTSALRIANIERTEAGVFRLNSRFVPPLLEIRTSDYLVGLVNGILEVLSAKSTQIAAGRRQKNLSLADFTASDIANFWLLYTVNSYIPVLNHTARGQRCHPEELFGALTALGASLTTFHPTIRPRDLPLYDHLEPGKVFHDLEQKLRLLLESAVDTHVVTLSLKQLKNTVYATAIDQDKYLSNTRMYLAVSSDTTKDLLISKVPNLVKVGSGSDIERLISLALPGVVLSHLPNPPSAIPVNLKYQYFSLNQSGPAWEAIARGRNLAVHMPGDFPNPQMELLILLPKAT